MTINLARTLRPALASSTRAVSARPPAQAKLRLGPVDDPLEREADRVADAVVGGQSAGPIGRAPPAAQRMCAGCAGEEREEQPVQRKCASCTSTKAGHGSAEVAGRAVSGGGTPLSPELRAYFEPRFARDLSAVRLHTHGSAAAAAGAIGARAFTVANDIGFASGEFRPRQPEGRRLIAHELAHVAQQRAGPPTVRRQVVHPAAPDLQIVAAGTTGALTADQRMAAASCNIACSGVRIGTLHAMPLVNVPTGVSSALHFVRNGTTPAATSRCANCTNYRMIQVVNTNLPLDPSRGNTFVDNNARPNVPFYDEVWTGRTGRHAIPSRMPDAGRQITATRSIYDQPTRSATRLATIAGQALSWNAEACVTCERSGPDVVLGCATYGFRRAWNSSTSSHGPVQQVAPACLSVPSQRFVSTLTNDSSTSSYAFETFRRPARPRRGP